MDWRKQIDRQRPVSPLAAAAEDENHQDTREVETLRLAGRDPEMLEHAAAAYAYTERLRNLPRAS